MNSFATRRLFVIRLNRLIAPLLFLTAAAANAQEQPYWTIQSGPGLSAPIRDGNESRVQADEWQIWLYPPDRSANGGPGRWGLLSGKTAADVRHQLERSQRFDRLYERWAHVSVQQDRNSSFNPFGPVAVLRDNGRPPAVTAALGRLEQLQDILGELQDGQDVVDRISGNKAPPTPFDQTGSVFGDYVDALKIARDKVLDLRTRLTDSSLYRGFGFGSLPELMRQIDEIAAPVDSAAEKYTSVQPQGSGKSQPSLKSVHVSWETDGQTYQIDADRAKGITVSGDFGNGIEVITIPSRDLLSMRIRASGAVMQGRTMVAPKESLFIDQKNADPIVLPIASEQIREVTDKVFKIRQTLSGAPSSNSSSARAGDSFLKLKQFRESNSPDAE